MPAKKQPGAGLLAEWNLGESQWKVGMDENLQYLSAAVQPSLLVTAGPLPTPMPMGSEMTLAWDDTVNRLKYWNGSAWVESPVQPRYGWLAWAADVGYGVRFVGGRFEPDGVVEAPTNGRSYVRKNGAWVAQDYLINTFISQISGDGSVQAAFIIPGTIRLPANAAGSIARCDTAASDAISFSIFRNNILAGTLTFAAGATVGTFSISATSFNAGDEISIVAPNPIGAVPVGVKILLRFEM